MARQPTPTVTDADVERVVAREFAATERAAVAAALATYGTETWEQEPARVRLAILKLAEGSLERVRACVDQAKADFRDVLLAAEYPSHARQLSHIDGLSPAERAAIVDDDWKQYQAWLTRA